jgi:hypothetical protein
MTTVKSASVFAQGAADLFVAQGKLVKATNKVIESWTPIIKAAMDAAGVEASTTEAKHALKVRNIFYGFMAEFFDGCPQAMEILKAQASLKCVGFQQLGGGEHLQSIIKAVKWPNCGPQILYVFKTLNALFNELGYKEVVRDNKKKKEEAPAAPASSQGGAPVPQVKENEMAIAVAKEFDPVVLLGLLDTYHIEQGPNGENWIAMLEAAIEMVREAAAALQEPVAA